jgi:HK97 family phage major capsid protein
MVDETSRANGSRHGGVVMSFTPEGEEITSSKPKFAMREMNRRKLAGLVWVSNEMLADFSILEATFSRLFGLEGAFVIENQIVNGGGAMGPLGIVNAGCTISVPKESGQAGATIVAGNIVNMFSRLWAPSKRRAVWLVNSDIAPQLYGLTWATGTATIPLFRWSDEGEPLLMGRPVIEVEYCPTLGSAGDIILADLAEYFIADPEEIDLKFSGDLGFLTDEAAFRVRMRIDGMPSWATPTTPLNGSATVSPFIALAARA